QGHENAPLEDLVGACLEVRRVHLAIPVRRRLLRVVVGRERLPHVILGTPDRRNSVEADFAGLEDDAPVEARRKRVVADPDILVPELDVPTPLRVPALVEVDEDVQPAVELSLLDVVEVDMDIEMAARAGLMDAAAEEFLIG